MSPDTGYVVAQTDTSTFGAAERPQFWREHVRLNHGGLDFSFDQAAGFRGSTVVQRSGDHQLVEFWSDPIAYVRSPRAARADDDRSIRVLVPRSGEFRVAGPNDAFVACPGAAVAISMASPFSIAHGTTGRAWVLSVPESSWPQSLAPHDPLRLDLRSGLGSVVLAMTAQVSAERLTLSEADFLDASASISSLLIRCLGSGSPDHLSSIARAAGELIRLESDDPTLTPASLSRRLGWSLRQVQVAVESTGTTLSVLIRLRRLSRAHTRLDDPFASARSIAEIAHASGFGSLSAFNAAFREEYQLSPREARSAACSLRTGTSGMASRGNTATAAKANP